MILVERADRFRSGTKNSIRCNYRDELVNSGMTHSGMQFGWYHVNEFRYSMK